MSIRTFPDPEEQARRIASIRKERSEWWGSRWWWPFKTKGKNKLQTKYREGWVEPPIPPEPLRSRMNKWFVKRSKVITGMVALCSISIFGFYFYTAHEDAKASAQADVVAKKEATKKEAAAAAKKSHDRYWKRVRAEAKSCEPMFFVKKRLVAHKLWEVTCIDKDGQQHAKYVQGKYFFSTPR